LTIKLFLNNFVFRTSRSPLARGVAYTGVLLTTLLAGCATPEAPQIPAVVVPVAVPAAPTALSEEADATLKAAEQSVLEARIKRALWTAAVEELNRARLAAKGFDSVATLRHAREAIALCELSIAQLSKAPVTWQ
jgi:hypothetical protein